MHTYNLFNLSQLCSPCQKAHKAVHNFVNVFLYEQWAKKLTRNRVKEFNHILHLAEKIYGQND